MAAKTVKMCDMPRHIAVEVFVKLNAGKVQTNTNKRGGIVICTDVEPKDLVYPEGWYYGKGTFRNKHKSTTGTYWEVTMVKSDGTFWEDEAKY